jgi:signal transduction histidine kinase
VDWLAGALVATIGVYAFAAPLLLRDWLRNRARVESLGFAMLAGALAAQALASALGAEKLARLALVIAFALTGDIAVRPLRGGRRTAGVAFVHGTATVLLLVTLAAPSHGAFVAIHTYGALVVLALLWRKARDYLAGERGNVGIVFGAALVLVAVLNDAANAAGLLVTARLVPLGFAALILGMGGAMQTGAMRGHLAKRERELHGRERQLRRSYDELRVQQEQLLQKEQLATVGELAAVIAHEVRNPLAIIANAVSSLRKATLGEPERAELLHILDDETSRLNRIVTDLLRYARPITVQRTRFAMSDLLARALQLASKRTGIKVELSVDAPELPVWGDSNLLRQVFDNLVDNAVQAMGDSGTLTVRVRRASEDGTDGLAVDIIDTGEGMDTAVRQRAKDAFFTTRPSGTGLGLAIVDRIVDAHGGKFEIDSRTGQGTRVTVVLPSDSLSEPPSRANPATPPGASSATP